MYATFRLMWSLKVNVFWRVSAVTSLEKHSWHLRPRPSALSSSFAADTDWIPLNARFAKHQTGAGIQTVYLVYAWLLNVSDMINAMSVVLDTWAPPLPAYGGVDGRVLQPLMFSTGFVEEHGSHNSESHKHNCTTAMYFTSVWDIRRTLLFYFWCVFAYK